MSWDARQGGGPPPRQAETPVHHGGRAPDTTSPAAVGIPTASPFLAAPEQARRKRYRRLSAAEKEFMFKVIAVALLTHPGERAISPHVEALWLAEHGWSPGRQSVLDYLSRPRHAGARLRALKTEYEKLRGITANAPVARIAQLDRIFAAAMRPSARGSRTKVIENGGRVSTFTFQLGPDLAAAVEAFRMREAIIAACHAGRSDALQLLRSDGGLPRPASSRSHRPDGSARPLASQPTEAHANGPTSLTEEEHRALIDRWDVEGIPPPGVPPRPTRRVLHDGRIEILEGKGAGTILEPPVPMYKLLPGCDPGHARHVSS